MTIDGFKSLEEVVKELRIISDYMKQVIKSLEEVKGLNLPAINTESIKDRNTRKLLGVIKTDKKVVKWILTRKTQFMTKSQREEAIENLLSQGKITMEFMPPPENGGRPQTVYSYVKDLD